MRLKLLILLIVTFISIGDIGENSSNTYRSLVDGYNGFYRVYNSITGELALYQNYTLDINVGDNIVWINKDPSDVITIISDQGLWESNNAILAHTDNQFNYTFNNPGIYTFNIKEYKALSKQTVIVSGISTIDDTINTTPTISPTIIPTEIIIDNTNVTGIDNTNVTGIDNSSITNVDDNVANNENAISDNPILMPLNILGNIKMIGIISFVIIIIVFFIKE